MSGIVLSLALTLAAVVFTARPADAAIQCASGCFASEAACAAATAGCGAGTSCAACVTGCTTIATCPSTNSASTPPAARRTTLTNPLGTSSITVLVGRATRIFMGVSGSFALLMFVYGGFMWVTSGGNMDRVKKGKQVFTYATIGLIVIYGSYLILSILFKGLQGAA